MRLPIKIAVRFLKSSKIQTLLIILGITVGVSVQVFIGSLIQGLQNSLLNKTIGNSPHVTITSNEDGNNITNYEQIVKQIPTISKEVSNIAISYDTPALISKNSKNYSILLRGMDISTSDKIYNIEDRIYEGVAPSNNKEAMLGLDLQQELGVKIGDYIVINTNTSNNEQLLVTGFYDLDISSLNKSWVITTLDTTQQMFSADNKVTSIELQVKDVFKADVVAANLSSSLSENLRIDNWKAQNESLLSGLNGQSVSSIMIQIFVLISVSLAIASVLAITVMQKSKQIGILKAMGIQDKTASRIFLFEGFLLGVIGAILGVILGLILNFAFMQFARNPDGTPVVEIYINYGFIALSAIIAIASSTFAALIPARRSSLLNPIEVIRNG